MLRTKSIQAGINKQDGIRICIMRKSDSWAKFDIWMPTLAPSNKLLDGYHENKIDWDLFEVRFKKEVIGKQAKFLNLLVHLALKWDITILCWEKTPEHCHRRLVAEACKKINSVLKVMLK